MAKYTVCGKTNEFTVTNETKYQELFSRLSGDGLKDDTVERAGVIYHSFSVIGDNGVSYTPINENGREDYLGMVDFMQDLSEILPKGIAASYTETGHEKANYQGAFAVIAAKDKPVKVIDLIDLVYQAETEMSNPVRLEIDTSKHDTQTMELFNKVFNIFIAIDRFELPPLSSELSDKMMRVIDEFQDPVEAAPDYFKTQKDYDNIDWKGEFKDILDKSIKELCNDYTSYAFDKNNNYNCFLLEDGSIISFEEMENIATKSNIIDAIANIKEVLEALDYSVETLPAKNIKELINKCVEEAKPVGTAAKHVAYTKIIDKKIPEILKIDEKKHKSTNDFTKG